MDEERVRAAVERLEREAHGFYLGTGVECRMVPVSAITELVDAVLGEAGELPDDVPTDRSSVT